MPSTESIDGYRARQASLEGELQGALSRFFRSLDPADPVGSKESLMQFVPALVGRFGPVSAQLAVEWYSELMVATGDAGKIIPAQAAAALTVDDMALAVDAAAAGLFTGHRAQTLAYVSKKATRWVQQQGRDTIALNAGRERVRWARVPTGRKTCAWCLTLASRDAVYLSRETAISGGGGGRYHGFCDCQAVRIASTEDYPTDYLPDDFYDMYMAARQQSGSGDIKDIVASMRRLYPDAVNDGVHAH